MLPIDNPPIWSLLNVTNPEMGAQITFYNGKKRRIKERIKSERMNLIMCYDIHRNIFFFFFIFF
jgi:hypothetical protein